MAASTQALHVHSSGPDAGKLVPGTNLKLPIWLPFELAPPGVTPTAGTYLLMVCPAAMKLISFELTHTSTTPTSTNLGISFVVLGDTLASGGMTAVPRSAGSAPVEFNTALSAGTRISLDISFPDDNAADYPGLTVWLKLNTP